MHTLVLLRHGESQSNQDNLFTGWSDVDLSEKGAKEAKNSGILLKNIIINLIKYLLQCSKEQ